MQRVIYIILLFALCSFSNYELTFEIIKKSNKIFQPESGKNEFHFLFTEADTAHTSFVAQIKLKGNDITVFDLYHKLREVSQNLGANSFRIVNKAKQGDSYYLLCDVYLADKAMLNKLKSENPDLGKVYIISPEPIKYLNKDKIRINENQKMTLISGTFYSFQPNNTDSMISIKGKKINYNSIYKRNEVKFLSTRYFHTFSSEDMPNTPGVIPNNSGLSVIIPLNKGKKYYKGNMKNKDGSVEGGLGKLLLEFSKPIAIN